MVALREEERWSTVSDSEVRVRYSIFVLLLVVVNVLYLLGETRNEIDTCLVAYGTEVILSFCCWCLYVTWWIRTGRGSIVYAWLTWLFLAFSLHTGSAFYARFLFITDSRAAYELFVNSWLWRWRMFPMAIMLCYMLALVLGRMFSNVEAPNGEDNK